ncbi:AraC family transcriptional regulator [Flavobacterium silvaticum]|uniref:Helix-turn-helix domain-containing protein n=1 Tax=Flavobacterium silvaticum TaxID=1852020 RepID=A0A972JGM7_9FLAO|nr:helix-turn-helix domain-containing protein [Flavobacterium silvaticum]NMH29204.1 helix-turn-helix domain-containing protein [Flavobacterium silvaticum]
MKLSIKNMVCPRCISAVGQVLDQTGITDAKVSLGEIELSEALSENRKNKLKEELQKLGFELLDDKDTQLVERIRTLIIELVYRKDNELSGTLSAYLSSQLNRDYGFLSAVFSQTRGITIEQFYILQKIERVKELLSYGEDNLNEIADRLGYSSPSHLSRQFKATIGMTPSEFRKTHNQLRTSIDNI